MRKNSHFLGQPIYGQVIKLLDKSKFEAIYVIYTTLTDMFFHRATEATRPKNG